MSLVKFLLYGFVLGHAIFLQSHPVAWDEEEEDNLLQGINSYRKSLNLPQLAKNDKATCLADELADKIEHQPCSATYGANTLPGIGLQSSSYQDALSKCKINPNSTTDGVILPVCVPKLVPTLVLTNYTRTRYQKYLNDSRFTGAGLGSEDDWMVLVLATSTQGGSFAGGGGSARWRVGYLVGGYAVGNLDDTLRGVLEGDLCLVLSLPVFVGLNSVCKEQAGCGRKGSDPIWGHAKSNHFCCCQTGVV